MPAEVAVDLEQIARLAGVSRSTVSRVVNGDRRVSPAARARVEAVVGAHDYHPNAAARSLASRRTRNVGLLIPNAAGALFDDPFFARLIQGAVEAGNARDHNLTLLMDTSGDAAAADRLYRRVRRGRHLDGVVVASSVVEDPIVGRLQTDDFPVVLVGRHPHRTVASVDVDNRAAARGAVAHLLDHGYRRIGLIAGAPNMIASIDRAAGYAAELEAAGIASEPALAVHADFTRRGGYRAMQAILAPPHAPPEAVFVASDTMASGALQALRDAGLGVPDDVAVMGFDGLEESAVSLPILSTVVQPIVDLGRVAVEALLAVIDDPTAAPIQRVLPTRLALRRSCGCVGEGVDAA